MPSRYLLTNALIVTGDSCRMGSLGIEGSRIAGIWYGKQPSFPSARAVDLGGNILLAGGIDTHVHFREPGMTSKACIASESEAALTGGITSFIDMPNTVPPTTNLISLEEKARIAGNSSRANYGFHIGATNDNIQQISRYLKLGLGGRFAGIKVFMGSSTGNMLVDSEEALESLFSIKGKPILVHCEDEGSVRANLKRAETLYGEDIPFAQHPLIRSREACAKSTSKAIRLAIKHGTRLHILHVSTAEEVEMIREAKAQNPLITAETSANYLWFRDDDYPTLGGRIKCNPAIKASRDRAALIAALAEGTIDTIGSDHAPHLPEEKARKYKSCPSGIPSVGESLRVGLTVALEHGIPLSRIASAFSENPARIFGIRERGFLRKGFYADLVVLNPQAGTTISKSEYKCGWTPYEGCNLSGTVEMVWVNGRLVRGNGLERYTATGQSPALPLRFQSIG